MYLMSLSDWYLGIHLGTW